MRKITSHLIIQFINHSRQYTSACVFINYYNSLNCNLFLVPYHFPSFIYHWVNVMVGFTNDYGPEIVRGF